ncbi:2S albumin, partial [Bienertia sinuspersici]
SPATLASSHSYFCPPHLRLRNHQRHCERAELSSHCERQLQWEKMEHCRQYLKTEMEVIMFPNSGNQACCLRECCEMLQDLDEECVCEALQSVAEEETQHSRGGEGRRQMGRVVARKAMQLPRRCGITAHCQESNVDATTSY